LPVLQLEAYNQGRIKLPIAAVQQVALNALLHTSLHAADLSLQKTSQQVSVFQFQDDDTERRRTKCFFGCFCKS